VCTCALTDSDGRAKADDRGERLRLLRQTRCGKSERQGKPVALRQTRAAVAAAAAAAAATAAAAAAAAAATTTATTMVARVARVTHLRVAGISRFLAGGSTVQLCAPPPRATGEYDPREYSLDTERDHDQCARGRPGRGILIRCGEAGPVTLHERFPISFPRRRALSLQFIHSAREMVQRGEKRVMK